MSNTVLCLVALSVLVGEQNEGYRSKFLREYDKKFDVCLQVADIASASNVDPVLAVSVARVESGFKRELTSSRGALGPLQVMKKHACTRWRPGCKPKWPSGSRNPTTKDLIKVGVKVLKGLLKDHNGNISLALCHYNQGTTCGKGGRLYAKRAQRYAEVYRRQLNSVEPLRKRRILKRHQAGRDVGK